MDELIYDHSYKGYRALVPEYDVKKHRSNLMRRMQILKGNEPTGLLKVFLRVIPTMTYFLVG